MKDNGLETQQEMFAHELLEYQSRQAPWASAVLCAGKVLTYRELNERANRLAHHLQSLGVGPDQLVGILLKRSPQACVALFGILKAGGACLPLDPATPHDRLALILKEGNARVIITDSILGDLDLSIPVVLLEGDADRFEHYPTHPPVAGVEITHLSRVFFTSGSMGLPKGVMWNHSKQKPMGSWLAEAFEITSQDRFLLKSSLAFTPINLEMIQPICLGATVVIAPPNLEYDMELMARFMAEQRITILNVVPTLLRLLLENGALKQCVTLRHVICFGEALAPELEHEFFNQSDARLSVIYGTTESPSSTFRRCERGVPTGGVNIGRPLGNKQVLLLNEALDLVPAGSIGEICIGGNHLAKGYLNDPALTDLKFIPNPFSDRPGSRLYRTGDLGRYLADGTLEFLGRTDAQVKLRGVRVELGEVEMVLRRHPLVRDAAVVDWEDSLGIKTLVAYLTGISPSGLDLLREFLSKMLPEAVIPSRFVFLEKLPLTSIGKIDRRALPDPTQFSGAKVGVRTPEEARIARIWFQLLGLTEVGVHESFFNIGGHSLLGARLASLISTEFGIDFNASHLFEAPTIAEQGVVVARIGDPGHQTSLRSILQIQKGSPSHPPLFFLPGGRGGDEVLLGYARFLRAVGEHWPVYGFRARGVDGIQAPHVAVIAMAADYIKELKEYQAQGPYYLGGECVGGSIAYEMAQQLKAAGEQVAFLGLLDTTVSTRARWISTVSKEMLRRLQESRRRMRKIPRDQWKKAFRKEIQRLARLYNDQLGRMGANPSPEDPKKRCSHQKRVLSAYHPTLIRYRPRPYAGNVHLFVSDEGTKLDITAPWHRLIKGELTIYRLVGDHQTYIANHSREVGEKFGTVLEAAWLKTSGQPAK